jgi:DNA-binding IclR family transcriptional regulator
MAVKRSKTASRVLGVLEAIAAHQPIGVSALARLLEADKSAIQRAIMTLADDGWIEMAPGTPTRWHLTHHILTVAFMGERDRELRQRARFALEALRDETGESALLSVPETHHFVVTEVVESRQPQLPRLPIGTVVPPRTTATGQVLLPHFSRERQLQMLGSVPDAAMLARFQAAQRHGYAVSTAVLIDGVVIDDAVNIAAPVFGANGEPAGAIAITAPSRRLTHPRIAAIAPLVAAAARTLSGVVAH